VTIKISGHPPFGAQVILNGHEYVAGAARSAGIGFRKEGSCFTQAGEPERLAQIADTFSQPGGIRRLGQVIDRWIYSACLCFGLNLDEQRDSGFVYDYSIYQVEYSRNLAFASGAVMDRLFNTMVDRTRSRLDMPKVRTLFGSKGRPHRPRGELSPRQAVVIEKPRWNLTIFKVHFGLLTLKAYTKGERVLRFEAIAHHTKQLGCGRTLDKFAHITARLTAMVDRFTSMLDCVEIGFLPDGMLDQLPAPSQIAATRIGGIDLNTPRVRAALAATLALAVAPAGFTVAEFTAKVRATTGQTLTTTASAKAPTTYASSAASSSSSNPAALAATTSPRPPREPSPHCSPSATRSSRPSSPASEHHDEAAHPSTGRRSTATTRASASTCRPCSTTSASRPRQRRDRQRIVDPVSQPSSVMGREVLDHASKGQGPRVGAMRRPARRSS
jgi:hypothetical protein